MKHIAKRLDSNCCLYRGVVIERNDNIPTTYSGRYRIGMYKRFHTLSEAKQYVDKKCIDKGKDSIMTKEQEKEFIKEWKECTF